MIRDSKGFSLIEVLAAMGIFTMIIGTIVYVLQFSFRSKNIVYEQLLTQSQGRKVLSEITNELRSARQSSTGAYSVASASSTELIFYTNMDADSYTERVRYTLNGNKLVKGIIKPTGNPLTYLSANETTSTAAESVGAVSGTMFLYYNQNYTGTSTPLTQPVNVTQVRVVGMQFYLERSPTLSPAALFLQGKAEIRNLKTN